jgi:hypothetical protein
MKTSSSPSIPRNKSLHHRLQTAKGPDGEPLPLLDELMIFLEDPPPDARDRWQAGADLCAARGITTSRGAVWSFYRGHFLQWRRKGASGLEGEVTEESTALLLEQARHLVALRAVESLQHPDLPPRVVVGMVQNENRRQELLLARKKFEDQLDTKERLLHQQHIERVKKEVEEEARARSRSEMNQVLMRQIMGMAPASKAPAVPPPAV